MVDVNNNIINTLSFNVKDSAKIMQAAVRTGALSESIFNASKNANLLSNNLIKSASEGSAQINKKLNGINSITDALEKQALKEEMLNKKQQMKDFSSINKKIAADAMAAERLNTLNGLMKESKLSADALNRALKNQGMIVDKTGQITDLFGNKINKADLNMKKLRKSAWRFNMNMLTLMFGFMALQRIVGQFGRSAITTYQKANEDTQGLGKSTWQLQAAWEFFKYSLVDALTQSALFQMLVQWVLQLVQWFNKLSPTTKSFIAIGLAVLFIIASVGVLFAVFQPLISFLATVIPWIASLLIGGLGAAFWWVAAIIGVVVLLWMSDLGNFRDFVKQTFGILWLIVKTVFGYVWDVVKDTLALIKAIFRGDFDEVYKIIVNMWKKSLAFTLKIFAALGAATDNIAKWMTNVLVDVAQFGVNALIAAVNGLIKVLNKVPGVKIPSIPPLDLSGYKKAYTTLEDVKGTFDKINSSIGIDKILNEVPSLNAEATASNKTIVDNSTNNTNLSFNLPEGVTDIEGLADSVIEKINDKYSSKNDSTL